MTKNKKNWEAYRKDRERWNKIQQRRTTPISVPLPKVDYSVLETVIPAENSKTTLILEKEVEDILSSPIPRPLPLKKSSKIYKAFGIWSILWGVLWALGSLAIASLNMNTISSVYENGATLKFAPIVHVAPLIVTFLFSIISFMVGFRLLHRTKIGLVISLVLGAIIVIFIYWLLILAVIILAYIIFGIDYRSDSEVLRKIELNTRAMRLV